MLIAIFKFFDRLDQPGMYIVPQQMKSILILTTKQSFLLPIHLLCPFFLFYFFISFFSIFLPLFPTEGSLKFGYGTLDTPATDPILPLPYLTRSQSRGRTRRPSAPPAMHPGQISVWTQSSLQVSIRSCKGLPMGEAGLGWG